MPPTQPPATPENPEPEEPLLLEELDEPLPLEPLDVLLDDDKGAPELLLYELPGEPLLEEPPKDDVGLICTAPGFIAVVGSSQVLDGGQ